MLRRLLFVLAALGVFAGPALAIDPYVRKHGTGVIAAGAPCAGDAISVDQQTCTPYFCNGSTWVQCGTGTGPGTSCTGAFTSNRIIKASSTGTSCSFVNSAISEDGTQVCVLAEDLGLVDGEYLFWRASCGTAATATGRIRWDTSATPDEFDFDADGTTRENLRAVLSGTNAALAGHSGAVDRTVDSSIYTTTPSAGTYRGRDIAGTVTVQASGGGGAAGTNLVTDNPSFTTGTLLDQDGWHELEVNLSIRDTTTFATTPAALRFDGDGSRAGNSESRPGGNGGPPGAAYYSLTTGTTYRLTVQSRQNSAGGNQDLRWTIHLFNGASDAVPAYSLQSSGGTPTTLIAGDIAANNFSRFVVTNAASFNPYTIDFLLDPGSSGASGTYLATVHFRRPDNSTAYSFWVDDVNLAPVVSNIDTNLTIVGLATDQFILAPATTVSGDAVSAVSLIGVHAKPKLAPVFPASGTATITSAEGVRAGVAYTADADGTTTVTNAASGFFETPAVGSSKYAAMFEGTAGWGTYAAASCVTRDSADHLYGDLDCDSTKDAGEEFLDLVAGASNSFVTIDTTSGTDPVADSATDTLTLTAGTGITITGNSATDAVTIASTGVGGSGTLNTIPMWTPDGVTLGNSALTDTGTINTTESILPTSDLTLLLGDQSLQLRFLEIGVRDIKGDKIRIYTDNNLGVPVNRFTFNGGGVGNQSASIGNVGTFRFADSDGIFVLGGDGNPVELRFLEPSGSGINYVAFSSGAQAANRSCVFQDAAAPIPDSCVGDGVDGGGISGLTADSGGATTGAAVSVLGGTNGIDTVRSSDTITFNFDPTETFSAPVPVANGGTGLASGTSGGVLAYTAAGTLASSAALAANTLVVGGGAGVVPNTPATTPVKQSSAGILTVQNLTTGIKYGSDAGVYTSATSGTLIRAQDDRDIRACVYDSTCGGACDETCATLDALNGYLTLKGPGSQLVFNQGVFTGSLVPPLLTGTRTWLLPDANGTIMMTASNESVTGIKTFSNAQVFTRGFTLTSDATGHTTSGDVWNDSTQKSVAAFTSGIKQMVPGVVFTQTADSTIGNSTTKTSILGTGVGTKILPINFFVAGKTIRATVLGRYSTTTVSGNITLDWDLVNSVPATVTVATTGSQVPAPTQTNQYFECSLLLTCRTTGASGTVQSQGNCTMANGATSALNFEMVETGTRTIDTTKTQEIKFSMTWATANAANTITATNATIEVLN